MPPLLADFIHNRVCKPICAKLLTLPCFPSPETKMPADLKDQLAFLFAHKENALLRFYKYNKYTKHNSIPTKHLKIMFFDKVH